MVSEGDLIGRDETERDERREWWLALLAEGETLGDDFLGQLRRSERVASDVMSKPVITVSEDTDTGEIARLLIAYRIKRVPVVRNGQMVGIVSRENLLRCWRRRRADHDVQPREGVVARALEDALAPLKWRFERPRHETEPHTASTSHPDEPSSAAADFRRLVAGLREQRSAAPRGTAPQRARKSRSMRSRS